MDELYLSGVDYESFADGKGIRTTLFISGCLHNCTGCHNPDTLSFSNGRLVTDELAAEINKEMRKREFLSGVTLSGGDPMYSADKVLKLLDKLTIPKNNIWLYTGFTWEELMSMKVASVQELISRVDVLVDGRFDATKADKRLAFRGSGNQRIINVKESLRHKSIVLWME